MVVDKWNIAVLLSWYEILCAEKYKLETHCPSFLILGFVLKTSYGAIN